MSDLLAECDWRDGTLFLVLPEDPERIGVRLFPSRHAPSRMYVPMAEAAQLKDENAKLRELVRNLYERFHGVVLENWSYSTEDFDMLACRMRELGVEVGDA